MGSILSRIYPSKPSTRDTLEKIERELQNIEERRWDKIKREQFVVQILSFIPITILIANVCILIYPSESTWRDKLTLSIPIVILNLILYLCKRMVQWYSKWSLENEEVNLRKLQKQKKRILEMVCETESYRAATELLEKYDPKQLRRREKQVERPTSPLEISLTKMSASPIRSPQQQQQQLQKQQQQYLQTSVIHSNLNMSHNQSLNPLMSAPVVPTPTPVIKPPTATVAAQQLNTTISNINDISVMNNKQTIAASSVQGRPVRPILSKDRSFFEKVVDWVITDGPENRFALICRFCYGHNGMCLAEEYETINFRCCYCYNLNTSTNKRHQIHDQLQADREKQAEDGARPRNSSQSSNNNNNHLDAIDEKKAQKKNAEQEEKEEEEELVEDSKPLEEDKLVKGSTLTKDETKGEEEDREILTDNAPQN